MSIKFKANDRIITTELIAFPKRIDNTISGVFSSIINPGLTQYTAISVPRGSLGTIVYDEYFDSYSIKFDNFEDTTSITTFGIELLSTYIFNRELTELLS